MVLVKKTNDKGRFNSVFDELFNGDFPALTGRDYSKHSPSVNVLENNDSYKIQVVAPGFKKEDLNVNIEDNMLTISGEFKSEVKEKEEKFTRKEFSFNSFSRSFNIPDTVNSENIKGSYDSGILTIELPKLEEVKSVSKQIQIS